MSSAYSKGSVPWTRKEMKNKIDEFSKIYECAPKEVAQEQSLGAPHQFLLWFALRKIDPDCVIESGVFRGYGSWFIEKALPSSELHCIDPNLGRIEYKPENATYYDSDFSKINWEDVPRKETVVLFDDHQDAPPRLVQAKKWKFKHLMFEDNYPPGEGDCFSLKQALEGGEPECHKWSSVFKAHSLRSLLRKMKNRIQKIGERSFDANFVKEKLSTYQELPPVFAPERTRWGTPWDQYASPAPLLKRPEKESHQLLDEWKQRYTWMCYAEIDYTN